MKVLKIVILSIFQTQQMHGMLQRLGQDSIAHFEKTSHARKTGTYVQRTLHLDAVSRLD